MTVAGAPVHRRTPELVLAAVVGVFVVTGILLVVGHDTHRFSSGSNAVVGSGVPAEQTRDVPPFGGVDLAGSNDVTVVAGAKRSVVVRGDDNLLDLVTTRVVDGTLVISNKESFQTRSPMSVEVSTPSLEALSLSGSGAVSAQGVDGDRLTIALSGSGLLRAVGSAERLDVTLDGSGDAQLEGLVARDVHAVVNGAGRVVVHATQSLDASVPGSGMVAYSGDPPQVTTRVTGVGAISPA